MIESISSSPEIVPNELIADSSEPPLDWFKLQRADPSLATIIHLMESDQLYKRKPYKKDSADVRFLLRIKKSLVLTKGILFRKSYTDNTSSKKIIWQLVVPKTHRHKDILGCHDDIGHQERVRTLSLLRERFFWTGMQVEATQHIAKCPRCLKRKSTPQVAPLQPILVSQSLELVHLDYLTLEPSEGNIENVLVITDHFTRYALAYASKTQTAQATARILWDNFICHYGFPEQFISDQGRNFESDLIQELCKIAGVKKLHTTPYHPQSNGQCERFNSTLCNMLGTLSDEEKFDWKSEDDLPFIDSKNDSLVDTNEFLEFVDTLDTGEQTTGIEPKSVTESQFSSVMSYHEGDSTPLMDPSTDSQELSKSLDAESAEELASGTVDHKDNSSHDTDVFASDTEESSLQSIQNDSSVQPTDSKITQSVVEDEPENVVSVEIAEPRRSGRARKQTAFYGNPLLYTITCKLTPRFVPVFFNKLSETLESLHTNYLKDSNYDDLS